MEYDSEESCKRRAKLKISVLTYYGNGKCACVRCGESRTACLSIDHIDGNGAEERRNDLKGKSLYSYLHKRGFPLGYQTLCMNCQWVKRFENNEQKKIKKIVSIQIMEPIGDGKFRLIPFEGEGIDR